MVLAVLAVLPDFFMAIVKVQVPFDLTITLEAVATQAPLGLDLTPTNLTLVEDATLRPNFFTVVLAEKVPFLKLGREAVKASSGEYPAVSNADFAKDEKLLATKDKTARVLISG